MPFGVRQKGSSFEVYNTETGEVKTTRDNRRDAERAAVLYGGGDLSKGREVGGQQTQGGSSGRGGPFGKIARALEKARR